MGKRSKARAVRLGREHGRAFVETRLSCGFYTVQPYLLPRPKAEGVPRRHADRYWDAFEDAAQETIKQIVRCNT